jgi:hypothetical protein
MPGVVCGPCWPQHLHDSPHAIYTVGARVQAAHRGTANLHITTSNTLARSHAGRGQYGLQIARVPFGLLKKSPTDWLSPQHAWRLARSTEREMVASYGGLLDLQREIYICSSRLELIKML